MLSIAPHNSTPTELSEALSEDQAYLLDDLSNLHSQIDQLLDQHDRQSGAVLTQFRLVEASIKALATMLGYRKEVFAEYDAHLRQQGLTTQIVQTTP
jgi:hypothetical protein